MNEVFETALEIAVKAYKGQVDKNGGGVYYASIGSGGASGNART